MTEDIKSLLQKNCQRTTRYRFLTRGKKERSSRIMRPQDPSSSRPLMAACLEETDGKLHQPTVPSDRVKDSAASLMPAGAFPNLDADRPADQSLHTAAALPSIPEPQRPVEAAKPPQTQQQPALRRPGRIKKKTRRLIEEFRTV